jgi:NAD(P)-dependent dehydrogenase (short-subunit alcohol dehydrogenase family)
VGGDGVTSADAPGRPGRLAGRGVIVTGATGIAGASVRLFAAEGARVFVISRTPSHCEALAAEVADAGGQAAHAVADLVDETQVAPAVEAAAAWLGRIDGLFNVAGGSGRRFGDGPLHTLTAEAWDRTMDLNARSHVLAGGPVVARMLDQEPDADGLRGAVLNMGSVLARHPAPEQFPTHAYAVAKGAIATLTLTTAAYYAPHGIRVNAVAPSLTTTPMAARAASDPGTVAFAERRQPLVHGFLDALDVARAALFLLSPEARGITGQVLTIDGGWSVTGGD